MKLVANTIASPLAIFISGSIDRRVFDVLRCTKIVPVYKKRNMSNSFIHRKIWILPVIGNLFRKMLQNRFLQFVNHINSFSENHLQVRGKRNAVNAIAEVVDTTKRGIMDKITTTYMLFDLKTAFDTVNHMILLQKLHNCGLRRPIKFLVFL